MAYWIDRQDAFPYKAASGVGQYVPVSHSASSNEFVLAIASSMTAESIGVTVATAASPGDPVAVQMRGVAKVIAAASTGQGANVGVASSNGAVGPLGASQSVQRVGIAQTAAVAGEVFSILLRPGKVGA
jgi:hypothetical protein